jgi:hypothetical protein
VKKSMIPYLQEILDEILESLLSTVNILAALHLFDENENATLLGEGKNRFSITWLQRLDGYPYMLAQTC